MFEWVDPKLLQVEASNQRNLSANPITLTRRIAGLRPLNCPLFEFDCFAGSR